MGSLNKSLLLMSMSSVLDMNNPPHVLNNNRTSTPRLGRSGRSSRYNAGTATNAWRSTTYFPPSKRNGAKECQRRIKQGLAGTCYNQDMQYPCQFRLHAAHKREAAAMRI